MGRPGGSTGGGRGAGIQGRRRRFARAAVSLVRAGTRRAARNVRAGTGGSAGRRLRQGTAGTIRRAAGIGGRRRRR